MDRHSFLLLSMSLQEAKAVLGFPPDANPSAAEIAKAWKLKAIENHPDRGGSNAKMVEVNVAKDVLDGKQRPTYDRSSPPSSSPPSSGPSYSGGGSSWYAPPSEPAPRREPPPPKPKPVVTTFDEAKSKAGVPSGVEWKFITATQYGDNYSTDESAKSDNAWVAYGKTESKHVFVGMRHFSKDSYTFGGEADQSHWSMEVIDFPLTDKAQDPAWFAGNVSKALKATGWGGRFNSKIHDIGSANWTFSEKFPYGSGTTIKHWLADSGQIAGDDPRVQNRKNVVEISYLNEMTQKPHTYKFQYGTADYQYDHDFEGIEIILNGKSYFLDENDLSAFLKLKAKGKPILNAIFGEYARHSGKKNLTRAQIGKAVIEWLGKKADSLPDDVRKTLVTTSEQMK